ncbi:MAG: dTMP kinase [Massiliimalia sp.]|jgi:dTMP kinase
MKGKLIVVDGLDGSGKSTQTQLLFEALQKEYGQVSLLSYPDYKNPSSALVRMYLNGEFSSNADDVNAYAASSFYAVDRYASYMKEWKHQYENGGIMIATRYVSSNAIHQMVKLPRQEWDGFLDWLEDFEYDKLGLPRPDQVIFLKMSRKVANELILSRYQGDVSKRDIHENNMKYLEQCMESAQYAAQKKGWSVISCCDGQAPYPVEQIAKQVLQQAKQVLDQTK